MSDFQGTLGMEDKALWTGVHFEENLFIVSFN